MSMPNSNAADDAAAKAAAASPEARERCTALCTKAATGRCTLCESLAARDAFLAAWRAGLLWPFVRVWSWVVDLWSFVDSKKGYQVVVPVLVTLFGAYVGLYTILEARHERRLNRALFERNAFLTQVITGPSGFRAAMDQFASLQNQKAPIEPDWLQPPWQWFGEYTPNREPLRQWAENFMGKCRPETCGRLAKRDETGKSKKDSKPWRIDLQGADLRGADLQGADLRGANLAFAHLRLSHLGRANLWGAHLKFANLWGADLRITDLGPANLWFANLGLAYMWHANLIITRGLTQAQINQACIYKRTKLPNHIKRPNKNPERCPPEPD